MLLNNITKKFLTAGVAYAVVTELCCKILNKLTLLLGANTQDFSKGISTYESC